MLKSKTIKVSLEDKKVKVSHIVDMIESILSCCVQKGVSSVSKDEIKQFYQLDNFDECFEETLPYLATHSFNHLEQSITYSFDLKRKLFDGTIVSGFGVQTAIRKSDY